MACDRLDDVGLENRFPWLVQEAGMLGYHQPRRAGHLSPRGLVMAQQRIAERLGCIRYPATAVSLAREPGGWRLKLAGGEELQAAKVVLAPGAWLNLSELLAGHCPAPALTLTRQTVAFLALPPAEAARLAAMPALVTLLPRAGVAGTYILPPIRSRHLMHNTAL